MNITFPDPPKEIDWSNGLTQLPAVKEAYDNFNIAFKALKKALSDYDEAHSTWTMQRRFLDQYFLNTTTNTIAEKIYKSNAVTDPQAGIAVWIDDGSNK